MLRADYIYEKLLTLDDVSIQTIEISKLLRELPNDKNKIVAKHLSSGKPFITKTFIRKMTAKTIEVFSDEDMFKELENYITELPDFSQRILTTVITDSNIPNTFLYDIKDFNTLVQDKLIELYITMKFNIVDYFKTTGIPVDTTRIYASCISMLNGYDINSTFIDALMAYPTHIYDKVIVLHQQGMSIEELREFTEWNYILPNLHSVANTLDIPYVEVARVVASVIREQSYEVYRKNATLNTYLIMIQKQLGYQFKLIDDYEQKFDFKPYDSLSPSEDLTVIKSDGNELRGGVAIIPIITLFLEHNLSVVNLRYLVSLLKGESLTVAQLQDLMYVVNSNKLEEFQSYLNLRLPLIDLMNVLTQLVLDLEQVDTDKWVTFYKIINPTQITLSE